jgi:hypothetical protein
MESSTSTVTLRLVGTIPSEAWNRFGTKVLPKLRGNSELKLGIDCSVSLNSAATMNFAVELRQLLSDLGLEGMVKIESTKQE